MRESERSAAKEGIDLPSFTRPVSVECTVDGKESRTIEEDVCQGGSGDERGQALQERNGREGVFDGSVLPGRV